MARMGTVKRTYHYEPGDPFNPRTRPDFRQEVFDALVDGSDWQAHLGPRLCADSWSVNDAVDALRTQPHRLQIEGDRCKGYRIVGIERWTRRGSDE